MTPYFSDGSVTLWHGDCLDVARCLDPASVDAVVTSPPYFGLRDYGHDAQWGAEATVQEYVDRLRSLFAELRRVLVPTGAVWLNLGDSYSSRAGAGPNKAAGGRNVAPNRGLKSGVPEKSLIGVPWRVALGLQEDGWAIRNAVVWHKPNPMPHPVADRLVSAYEFCFLLAPAPRYHFDLDPVREPLKYPDAADGTRVFGGRKATERDDGTASSRMTSAYGAKHTERTAEVGYRPADGSRHTGGNPAGRNPGDVWTVPTQPFTEAHFAVMPAELARRMVVTACPPGGVVLDPFSGSGTTGLAAATNGRRYVGIDASQEYLDLSLRTRLAQPSLFGGAA